MATDQSRLVPPDDTQEIQRRVLGQPRAPVFAADMGLEVERRIAGEPPPDWLSSAIRSRKASRAVPCSTLDLSSGHHRPRTRVVRGIPLPRYRGHGRLPFNVDFVLRDLESRFGSEVSPWELQFALFRARDFLDENKDYWERGASQTVPR